MWGWGARKVANSIEWRCMHYGRVDTDIKFGCFSFHEKVVWSSYIII